MALEQCSECRIILGAEFISNCAHCFRLSLIGHWTQCMPINFRYQIKVRPKSFAIRSRNRAVTRCCTAHQRTFRSDRKNRLLSTEGRRQAHYRRDDLHDLQPEQRRQHHLASRRLLFIVHRDRHRLDLEQGVFAATTRLDSCRQSRRKHALAYETFYPCARGFCIRIFPRTYRCLYN